MSESIRVTSHYIRLDQVSLLCVTFRRISDIRRISFTSLLLEVGDLLFEKVISVVDCVGRVVDC